MGRMQKAQQRPWMTKHPCTERAEAAVGCRAWPALVTIGPISFRNKKLVVVQERPCVISVNL